MRVVATVLIVAGIVTLVFAGIAYTTRDETAISFGGVEANVTEQKKPPVPPAVGAIALLGGVAILAAKR
jgi:hypothetical protein